MKDKHSRGALVTIGAHHGRVGEYALALHHKLFAVPGEVSKQPQRKGHSHKEYCVLGELKLESHAESIILRSE